MPLSEPIRPDLSGVDPAIRAYIEYLESQIERLSQEKSSALSAAAEPVPVEPPGPLNIITATASGIAKRTPVHFYARQRRGGMGVFDLDAPVHDPPAILSLADDNQTLLLLTSHARAFRLPVSSIPETSMIRARGESIVSRLNLAENETLVSIQPALAQGYLVLLSKSGMLRSLRHHIFGEYMKPGLSLYDIKSFGPLAAACWSPGDGDLFIATRQGRAIRFAEKLIPPQGCQGIRLAAEDCAVAVTPAYPNSEVFLLGADGRGSVRSMSAFSSNKAPGSGGKNAMATSHLVAAINIDGCDDAFILSRLGKIIRFQLGEVPTKDGVVQGVICMNFRNDEAVAAVARRPIIPF